MTTPYVTQPTLVARAIAESDANGVTRSDIARITGLANRAADHAIRCLRLTVALHFTGAGTRYRYFACAEWAAAYASPEQVALRADVAYKADLKRRSERCRKSRAKAVKAPKKAAAPKPVAPSFASLPAVIPEGLRVKTLPGFTGRSRFEPADGFVGEFSAEWRAKVAG